MPNTNLHLSPQQLRELLRRICPKLQCVQGCYLRSPYPPNPSMLLEQGFRRADIERQSNRFFLIAELLDHIMEGNPTTLDPQLLLGCAQLCAGALRQQLATEHPEVDFVVEIIGEDGLEDEPLELAVTFYQAPPDPIDE